MSPGQASPDAHQMLSAFQFADSTFPSGGFAFSQGLEAASEHQDHLGPFDLEAMMRSQIQHRWACSDRVALIRAHRLGGALQPTIELDHEVEACTLVEALRLGSRRNGAAMLIAYERMGLEGAKLYRRQIRQAGVPGHLSIVQGLVWQELGLAENLAVAMSGYQAVMSLSTAAVRLGLTGALEVQAVIGNVLQLVGDLSSEPVDDDELLSSFVPLSEIAVSWKDSRGQRLFSN